MQPRHSNKELYFQEQVFTTKEFVIPFIEEYIDINDKTSVLEVGCGEGGNLVPFLDQGCRATGVDLSEGKIELAVKFLQEYIPSDKLKLLADDIYNLDEGFSGAFDLIILRDVIEHIHDQGKFMGFIKKFLKKDGMIFFGFPPWYNPFGGHQQICENRLLSKMPYFHILPLFLYKFILKTGGEPGTRVDELLEIKQTGISIERFERILVKQSFKIVKRKLFLFNPNYKVKFNIRPREQFALISKIFFLRNFITTACYYLIGISKNSNKYN
jgi:SAM-dependent methyltransferase